ncbi:MAG: hypothetical protein Q7T97_01275 [Burkholderiaceae bacterium]|nr:hypothetical protein [Burkholderiaceae bacterium]
MSEFCGTNKGLLSRVLMAAAVTFSAGAVQAVTPFENDVSVAIDRGITYLATTGAFSNPSSAGDAAGLPMLALLEKRASGIATDPPQGYTGANATDQGRLRTAAANILDRVNETGFYSYRDGAFMFALSEYALTGGPDKSALGAGVAGNVDYQTIKEAMNALVDRALAGQDKASYKGYWCYSGPGCPDSSTTQFVVAGLAAAKTFYSSNKSGDGGAFADAARVTAIDAALVLARQAYETNAAQGSDNGACAVLSPTERGHGYNAGYNPSLQQTASGMYNQLFGGSNVNTPMVQHYIEWLRNHYRWEDLDNMGNSWPTSSWSYYLWSSFKGMELIRQSGISPAAGNLGANDLGKLSAASAPSCAVRQENKDPALVSRPAVFGAGAAGFYVGEPKGQYFDYAHQILSVQCANGAFACGSPGYWDFNAHQSYLLLVLQRSTGGGCADSDGDGVCDSEDNCPAVANPGQQNTYGDARGDACEPRPVASCDLDSDGDVDSIDIAGITALRNKPASANPKADADGNGVININDARACVLKCTRSKCATQ